MLPTYEPGQARAYCQEKGWQYKTQGDELILKECPFCLKKDKLSLNDQTGAYQCFSAVCGKQGNYFMLRRDMGDQVPSLTSTRIEAPPTATIKRKTLAQYEPFHQALLDNQPAMAYLTGERGLTIETIKKWKLGLKEVSDWDKDKYDIPNPETVYWLMIPYLTKQGVIADVKYRALPPAPKRFKRMGGGESILFGEHLLPPAKASCDVLYLVEGEIDAITLDQHGFQVALSTTTGAKSFSPRWYDLIVASGAKRIVLIYDSDADGRAGADKLAQKFNDGELEVVDLILPDAKDSNEYFKLHTVQDFKDLLEQTAPVEMEHVLSSGAVLDMLADQIFNAAGRFDGIPSQFMALNGLMDGGYGNGSLTSILAASGVGKTSFMIQELLEMGNKGLRPYLCCIEMPPIMIMRKVINYLFHIPIREITLEHINEFRADIERRGVRWGRGVRDIKELDKIFRKAARRFDLNCIVFDNVHYIARGYSDENSAIALITQTFKNLAMDLNIPVIQLCQPRKFDKEGQIISAADARGSQAIEADSDNMLMMWRPTLKTEVKDFGKQLNTANMGPLTLFKSGKARFSAGGETLLYFHGEYGKFRALSQDETSRLMQDVNG